MKSFVGDMRNRWSLLLLSVNSFVLRWSSPPISDVEDYRQVMQRIEENNEEEEVTDEKRKKNEKTWEQQKVTNFFEMIDEENEQEKITTEQIVTENSSTRGKYDRAKDMQTASTRIRSPVQVSETVTKDIHGQSTSPCKEIREEKK